MREECSSEWKSVTSEILQEPVLGPLFVIYISHLDVNIGGMIGKFVDN